MSSLLHHADRLCAASATFAAFFVALTAHPAFGQIPREFIYIGDQLLAYQASFVDVPPDSPDYAYVNNIANRGITSGCGGAYYCPTQAVTRETMPVFVLKAKEGSTYAPPTCIGADWPRVFEDVPDSSPFCPWIYELYHRGVVAGCAPDSYCPSAAVKRQEMAVYLLRTLDPNMNPPACVAGQEMFGDVPASDPFCRWIEELARRGIEGACQTNPPLFCPLRDVDRGPMARMLVRTFGL